MIRMARGTKAPEVLREIHAALQDDPILIAETFARATLAGRLVRSWYARDARFHGALRGRAEAALAESAGNPAALRPLADRYEVAEWILGESSDSEAERTDGPARLEMPTELFAESRAWLARALGVENEAAPLPLGKLSRVQEEAGRFCVVSVLAEGRDRLTVATASWDKTPFSTWWGGVRSELQADPSNLSGPTPNAPMAPMAAGTECEFDRWEAMPEMPAARRSHRVVWTGTEMLVFGGYGSPGFLASGYRYNASTDTWYPMNAVNSPSPREEFSAVWTGTEMIVWGGYSGGQMNTGGRYNPLLDIWSPTSLHDAPGPRQRHSAVWTGTEMIIWGGDWYQNSGGRYSPSTDTWTFMPSAADGRFDHTAVWTGTEMIVWGGYNCRSDGDRFNPQTNSWQRFYGSDNPGGRRFHVSVWTGSRMLVWGGECSGQNGGLYDPSADSWSRITSTNAPSGYAHFAGVWTGTEFVTWSGCCSYAQTGGRYNPDTNTWRPTSTFGAPQGRNYHSAVWTGSEVIFWGGQHPSYGYFNSGGRYDPSADAWTPTSVDIPPAPRQSHATTWTGAEMFVFGGYSGGWYADAARYLPAGDIWEATADPNLQPRSSATAVWTGTSILVWGGNQADTRWNDGSRYNPMLDTWTPTTSLGAPRARTWHTAVWTGSRMVVWGGHGDKLLNSGAMYDPDGDAWTPTDLATAPTPRAHHTAIWGNNRMIVWGGDMASPSGAQFDPVANVWTPTATTGAPSARQYHTAAWSGNRMFVWGGSSGGANVATGGIYDPASDAWSALTTTGAPAGRSRHGSVWADKVLLVWGGYDGANELATGGKYIPAADQWQPIGTAGAPGRRSDMSTVWDGSRMMTWGGYDATSTQTAGFLNSGSRYCACNATDGTCDGLDQDCDGTPDDEYPVGPSWCGVGACASTGESTCVSGVPTNTCVPGAPAPDDSICNAIDDDCSGATDEDYVVLPTTCGVGACFSMGATSCVAGAVQDSCTPETPAASDPTCNAIDDDCDGTSDEEYVSLPTTCGVGACFSTGTTSCVGGAVQDSCTPGPPAPIDNTCNGVDDDCNGVADEEFVPQPIACGVGACHRTGTTSCVGGVLATDCTPGAPESDDATCNGVDEDCNGTADEDYVSLATTCGVGGCERSGSTSCVGGGVVDSCTPGASAEFDGLCNGIDDDCDGQTDEDYISQPTTCGIGACQRTGSTNCVGGSLYTDCTPGAPGVEECTNGIDDDCDGLIDSADADCAVNLCPDADGDGYSLCRSPCTNPDGVGCDDCDDSNPDAWLGPSEVMAINMHQNAGLTELAWSSPSRVGATSLTFDVLRSGQPNGFELDSTCVAHGVAETGAQDAEEPLPDGTFFYLVRAVNACPDGLGPLGSASGGSTRVAPACP
jgi:N-acetylneuraminic acid mutarotase